MKFQRQRTRAKELEDKFLNSFYKTGFINEQLFETKDRDIWLSFLDLLTDVNTSTIYSSICIGWREIPYSEKLLQRITLKETSDTKHINKKVFADIFASIDIINCRFFELLFIMSPMMGRPEKKIEIQNTLHKVRTEYSKQFNIVKHVTTFLKEQLPIHTMKDDIDPMSDLFLKSPVIVLVPILKDNAYYEIEGLRYYPYLSETYHYSKSRDLNQIKFIFKSWYGKESKFRKFPGYFDKGEMVSIDEETGEEKHTDILYCKFFRDFYNPFCLFDRNEIDDLMADLATERLQPETRRLLQNNYEHYISTVGKARVEWQNRIPAVRIFKDNDPYYRELMEEQKDDLMDEIAAIAGGGEEGSEEEADENAIEIPELEEETDEDEEAPVEVVEEEEPERKISTVSRRMLSLSTLKSLIMGYDGFKYLSFYPHLGDTLLDLTKLDGGGGKGSISPKHGPGPHQVYMTIKANSKLFKSYDATNPIDVHDINGYKKRLQPDKKKLSGEPGAKQIVNREDRFMEYAEYGITDPSTVKSPENAGLQSVGNPLKVYADHYKFKR